MSPSNKHPSLWSDSPVMAGLKWGCQGGRSQHGTGLELLLATLWSGLGTLACLDRAHPAALWEGDKGGCKCECQGRALWGQALLQERLGAAGGSSPGTCFTVASPLTGSRSTRSRSLLAPAAGSVESLAPAEYHKSQTCPICTFSWSRVPGGKDSEDAQLGHQHCPCWNSEHVSGVPLIPATPLLGGRDPPGDKASRPGFLPAANICLPGWVQPRQTGSSSLSG